MTEPLLGDAVSLRAAARVLVVDDDEALRKVAARVLTAEGFEVSVAADGRQALALLEASKFDVVVTDVSMPNMTGLELLRAIRQRDLELPVILQTGQPSMDAAVEARRNGALHYLTKPVENTRLVLAVTRAERLGRVAIAKRIAMDALDSLLPRAGDLAGLELSLRNALANMWMAYQPIVRCADRTLFGHEALMRSKEASLPHPGAILDAAERLGRLPEVGRRVRGLAAGPLSQAPESSLLFVNLHSADLEDDTLVAHDSPLVKVASRIVLEITERAAIEKVAAVEKRVAQLREIGFRIAVDDLGAGYAGLTSFALLEPEIVKLDMTLVRDVDKTPTKSKLIKSLCTACRDLGVLVVGEGVESAQERDCLVELGCDLLQGYLLGRPGEAFPAFSWGD